MSAPDPARTQPVWIDEVPPFRAVDALSGDVAVSPSKFWAANEDADARIEEFEGLREENARLRCRVDELDGIASTLLDEKESWMARARRDNGKLREQADGLAHANVVLTAERDDLDEKVAYEGELRMVVVHQNAELKHKVGRLETQLAMVEAERDTLRGTVPGVR